VRSWEFAAGEKAPKIASHFIEVTKFAKGTPKVVAEAHEEEEEL